MNVIIAGAGEVGTYTAEVLTGDGHNVTVIDARTDRLTAIEESLDVRTLAGNAASAETLREAGVADPAAALVAATSTDEVNLLCAAVGRGLGVGKTIARVHHSVYFEQRGLDYRKVLGIDRLVCPEHATANAIASTLRNPAALAIEAFASGRIEVEEFPVTPGAAAVGKTLLELPLPEGIRLAAIRRGDQAFLPHAESVIQDDDVVVLVGNADIFQQGRRLFQKRRGAHARLVLMGGTTLGVWLCRALRDRAFSIRLFEPNRHRAEELADKLGWVTILHADPTDLAVFEEERVADADAFIGLSDDDEHNILGCAWAKGSGVPRVIACVQRRRYVDLIGRVGIDQAFSPREVAVKQIERSINDAPLLRMASLAEGVIDVYRVRVSGAAAALGQPLRRLKVGPDWMIAAVNHDGRTFVPTADDFIHAGDDVMAIGRAGREAKLKHIF